VSLSKGSGHALEGIPATGGIISALQKARIRFWAGIAISVIALILAVRSIDLGEVSGALARVQGPAVLLALLALALTLLAKAARWRVLFRPHYARVRFSTSFTVLIIGQMVNTLFPLRLGEVARAYLIGERDGVSKTFAFGTIVVEKMVDMALALLLLLLLIPWLPLPTWTVGAGTSSAISLGILLAIVGTVAWQKDRARGLTLALHRRLPLLPKVASGQQLTRALDSLDVLRQGGQWLSLTLLSILAWAGAVLTNYFTFLALDIHLPLIASVFLLLVLQIGVAVPSAPGKIGVFQYLTVLALSIFSVGASSALSVGILLYLIVYIPPVVGGLLLMWAQSLSLVSLRDLARSD
jgi:hypothetical protein